MKNLWNDRDAGACGDDLLALRVYSSRLIGKNSDLVLHGGGNTSVKAPFIDLFGERHKAIYIKGSGWDLATIEEAGFAPVRLDALIKLSQFKTLSDTDMVTAQRVAMLNQNAPNPSVEAILHAIIPFRFVDHTHADAVVTLTNTPDGEERIRTLYGNRVLVVPYVMPGFELAKKIVELTRKIDWSTLEAMVLMNHGIFSFANEASDSYDSMIRLVSEAEEILKKRPGPGIDSGEVPLLKFAELRSAVSVAAGKAMLARFDGSASHFEFASRPDVDSVACRGPLTPDHVIRTKRLPIIIEDGNPAPVDRYARDYETYFKKYDDGYLTQLDAAPRWAIWRNRGTLTFGSSDRDATIVSDIVQHTIQAIEDAERLGGWVALPEKEIFSVEYWELEQAKLGQGDTPLQFCGQVALVTGGASGIGRACVESLVFHGAQVVALDRNSSVIDIFNGSTVHSLVCDVTDRLDVTAAIQNVVRRYGGLDIVISNAGVFSAGATIEEMDSAEWQLSLDVNLTSAMEIIKQAVPYLRYGWDPTVIIVGSKNVPAPGPAAAAYSVAKAGLTQLGRVAALELAKDKIRVNTVHPNAVFDTAIWTEEVLASRAARYGLSVEQYRTKNLLGVEVTSKDVAAMVCAMAGTDFSRTTGAQVPVDGGTERVV
jgi:rhamnose utilization protein RhaD (predicted bifunctional aldolase and dehydrogenase)/NAD(P)-dependent dehydrogenase (short-subunit alcohol dehydrogenase family)